MMEVDGKKKEADVTATASTCEPCGREIVSTEAAGLCRECEEYMCQLCFDHHLKAKICMNHCLISGLKSSVSVDKEVGDVVKCKQHDGEVVKYYCRTHDTVGCGDCMLSGGHNSCHPTNIQNVANNFKNEKEFKQVLKQAENLEKDKNKTARMNQVNRLENQALKQKLVNEVRKFRIDVDSILDEAEANILSKIENLTSRNEEKISMAENEIESLTTELVEIRKKLDAESYNDNLLFINAVDCRQQLKGLAQALDDSKSRHALKQSTFQPDENLNKMITTTKSLGNIKDTCDGKKYMETSVSVKRPSGGGTMKEENDKNDSQKASHTETDYCTLCLDIFDNPKTLKCGHKFCCECIDKNLEVNHACPTCGGIFGVTTGEQPPGHMKVITLKNKDCAGYSGVGQIIIMYNFADGRQESCHPNPGNWYVGIARKAYLPDNVEGRKLLEMLKVAFERKLVFTIGPSSTTGQDGVIIWNGIHHKTDPRPNTQFGYPDPTYLERLREELAEKGITADDIPKTQPDN